MRIYNNEITCQRGESFQINRRVINSDNTPYIVPQGLHNPYLCLTIASVSNNQNNRYLKNWWVPFDINTTIRTDIDDFLDGGGIPRFYASVALDLRTITTGSSSSVKKYPSWTSVPSDANLTGYIYGNSVSFNITSILNNSTRNPYFKECVFYGPKSASDNTILYKYYCRKNVNLANQNPSYTGEWREYNFDISFPMTSSDTSELISQKYLYGISLQAGNTTEYIYNNLNIDPSIKEDFGIIYGKSLDYIRENYPDLYDVLKDYPNLFRSITESTPLAQIDFVQAILEPTNLFVNSNLRGGF